MIVNRFRAPPVRLISSGSALVYNRDASPVSRFERDISRLGRLRLHRSSIELCCGKDQFAASLDYTDLSAQMVSSELVILIHSSKSLLACYFVLDRFEVAVCRVYALSSRPVSFPVPSAR